MRKIFKSSTKALKYFQKYKFESQLRNIPIIKIIIISIKIIVNNINRIARKEPLKVIDLKSKYLNLDQR